MAWRDSRGRRAPLLLSMGALALGIAVLVALRLFGAGLEDTLQKQSRQLLGADYSVRALHPFDRAMEELLAGLPGEQVRETRFSSMVRFPAADAARLSQVRALSAPFPFYGVFETEPAEAAQALFEQPGQALVEEQLWLQMEARIGDPIQIGDHTFTLAGRLRRVSGEAPATSGFLGPRVYIALGDLDRTNLIQPGSLARHLAHFRAPPGTEVELLQQEQRPALARLRLEMETAGQRQELLGTALNQLYRYLNLGALAALLLGGIGCAGAVQLYARQKRPDVALLRCLGCSARKALAVYTVQVTGFALLAALAGVAAGSAAQRLFPWLLSGFLPFSMTVQLRPGTVILSLLTGTGLAAAFTLLPLLALRRVSPMCALRLETHTARRAAPDPAQWALGAALILALFAFSAAHTDPWRHGIGIACALLAVFGLLLGTAHGVMRLARRVAARTLPFAWRQGLANIHRPYNQTSVLLLALGLGSFLLATLALTQSNLSRQLLRSGDDDQPNLILFDVQPGQVEPVEQRIAAQDLEVIDRAPIVTMRLTAVNGVTVGRLRDDPDSTIPHWVLFREYRSTYTDELRDHDTVLRGGWLSPAPDGVQRIPVSVDEGLVERLGVGLGARLTFDIQGVPVDTEIRSIRRVDWRQLRLNFFVIFPAGVLEEAPQYHALVTRASTAESAARLQNALIEEFPNISVFDLNMVVQSMNEVLDQAALIVRFMALFSVATGLLILGGAVVAGRYDRREEIALWRMLGAGRNQINRLMAAEYLLLGSVASLSGLLLALLASAAIARWLFEMPFAPAVAPLLTVPVAVTALTVGTGWLVTRALLRSGHRRVPVGR